jgi:hypothetical protein
MRALTHINFSYTFIFGYMEIVPILYTVAALCLSITCKLHASAVHSGPPICLRLGVELACGSLMS